jgi:ubiquinone/menaquinone biosynthesis C-methylase UbiE
MRSGDIPAVKWAEWSQRWEDQQTGHWPTREDRFRVMFDVLEALYGVRFTAVDLACGPGSLSKRLLTRFPQAKSIAVDVDPVLLAIGRGTLGDAGGRLAWVDADLTDSNWVAGLGLSHVDAVVTTSSLHWLPISDLVRVYRQIYELLKPGGALLNGEAMSHPPSMTELRKATDTITRRRHDEAVQATGAEEYEAWWKAINQEPGLQELLEARRLRFEWQKPDHVRAGHRLNEAAMWEAGFREVGQIWQDLDQRVFVAIR